MTPPLSIMCVCVVTVETGDLNGDRGNPREEERLRELERRQRELEQLEREKREQEAAEMRRKVGH